jgi:hypothetical protein
MLLLLLLLLLLLMMITIMWGHVCRMFGLLSRRHHQEVMVFFPVLAKYVSHK